MMIRRIIFSIFLMTTMVLAQDVQNILDRVESSFKKTKILEIEFEETYIWKLTGEKNTITGNLIMKGEDRFRIETEDQIIVSDGDTLWTYSKPADRVLIDKLSETSELLLPRQILLEYTKKYQAVLQEDEQLLDKSCKVIRFNDPLGEQYYITVQLWVDESLWLPIQLLQEDVSGNQNVFLLKTIEKRESLDSQTFKFDIPQGADIIRM